jgi:hypothetical protein
MALTSGRGDAVACEVWVAKMLELDPTVIESWDVDDMHWKGSASKFACPRQVRFPTPPALMDLVND